MLAMAGALDGMAPFAKAMASDMPDVKLMVIPRANHLTAFNDEFIEAGVKFWGARFEPVLGGLPNTGRLLGSNGALTRATPVARLLAQESLPYLPNERTS